MRSATMRSTSLSRSASATTRTDSTLCSASSFIYLLLRKEVDGIEVEEVFVEEISDLEGELKDWESPGLSEAEASVSDSVAKATTTPSDIPAKADDKDSGTE